MRSESIRKEKRRQRNTIIIGLVLLFTMVFSMLAISFNKSSNVNSNLDYNGHTFTIEDVEGGQMATTVVNGQKYSFYRLPVDAIAAVENITGVKEISSAPSIIFVKEPLGLNNQASSEQIYFDALTLDVRASSGKVILSGISREDAFSDMTVYNCSNASEGAPVVMLKDGIYQSMNITETEPNCYEITSDSLNLLILRDYIIYKSIGIIQ